MGSILLSPADTSNIMGVPACLGAFEPIQAAVYQGSGFTAMRGQGLRSTNPPNRVYEVAVAFPSAEIAHTFVKTSADNWKACGGQTVTITDGSETNQWTFADLNGAPPKIVQRRTQVASITNEGIQVADQMAAKVTP